MKPKAITREFVLLSSVILVAWLLAFWITGSPKLDYTFDISLNDTYIVVKGSVIIITIFLILISVFYLVRGAILLYKQLLPNIVTLIILFAIVIFFSKLINVATRFEAHLSHGWTIYPPLSALPKAKPVNTASNGRFISSLLSYIQIFFLLILVIVAIITGKNWKLEQ